MGLLDRIREVRQPKAAWPVGPGVVEPWDAERGHDDDRFSPESYGDYLVTSNEIFSAANLRARLMSSLDLLLYQGRGPDKAEVLSGPAHRLLSYVNPFWSPRRLARMDELSMCIWGESYWAVERGPSGEPSEIWWLKASRVKPVPHEKKYLQGFVYEPAIGGELIRFDADEVIWFRYPNPLDEFSALSPLAAARLAADAGSAMMKSNRNLFTNGMQLGGLIVPDTGKVQFSAEQADDLERSIERRFKGVDKAHRWAVLRYEAQFKSLEVSPKDAEWVSGLDLTLRQVANAYGIPAPLLNDLAHATLSNTREFERILWANALVPDAQLRADEIEEQLLPKFRQRVNHCAFDFSKVPALQESATETWTRESQQIERGALTINEWRRSKGMPDVEWGDVYWAPVNKAPVASGDDVPADDPDVGNAPPAAVAQVDAEKVLQLFSTLSNREPAQPVVVNVQPPPAVESTTRRVERDESGRIVAVIDE